MKQASIDLDFEAAANYRDQLIGLRTIQESMAPNLVQIWMLSVSHKSQIFTCIEVIFVRSGKQIANESFFPRMPR